MRHIFYIDPLEKLNIKKDSTLRLAIAMKARGIESYVLFEKDLAWGNTSVELKMYRFEGEADGAYLKSFRLADAVEITPVKGDVMHMRLDPPFDGRYLRYLWILDQWEARGVRVINSPRGIMQFNEKLLAYEQLGAVASWVGEDAQSFEHFRAELRLKGVSEIVLKPLDLYSGIGVEKWSIDDAKLSARFVEKARELGGPIVAQSFMPEVHQGEIRALYYAGKHLGSILKKPKEGEFISNIAQGAAFSAIELPASVQTKCEAICARLTKYGVLWVAFDILGGTPTEVNVTCPGLLVEVSHAHQKNLADVLIDLI
jgi:glutathione synthase